jgi:omega-6 fatty acid desaturase (delta-12 desaturase)
LSATLSVEPRNFNCLLPRVCYYHEIAAWGDFNAFYFVVIALPISSKSRLRCDASGNQNSPHNADVPLMVEKSSFTAPPSAYVARRMILALGRYREPRHCRSIFEIAVTLVPFVALWASAWAAVHFGYWELSFLLGVPAAGFLVRLFMIQHDCGHGSFFRNRPANDWVGRFLGVLTLTPYDDWRRAHAIHHANSGHLDRRGVGDINTLTVREFQALAVWGRLRYRLYRHPLVMFGLGAAYQFLLRHRLPTCSIRGWHGWISAMATNLAIAVAATALIWFIGLGPFLLVHLPIALLAGSVGVWLFYVQHQFEETFWAHGREWDFHEASLHGSSHYDLPAILRWFTANIGVHHVHHLCSRIPYYRLPQTLQDHPDLRSVSRLTLFQSFRCVRLALWDETRGRLVSFREIRARI